MRYYAAAVATCVVLLSAGASSQAVAQESVGPPIILNVPDPRKDAIEEQRLAQERDRADEAARQARAAEHQQSVAAQTPHNPPSTTVYNVGVGNPLEGTDAPKCTQSNGAVIQVTGGFHGVGCK